MKLYRLTREKYASDLSGEGAKRYGGRWNSTGNAMLYTATHRSLAVLETLVNLPKNLLPQDMVLVTLSIAVDEVADLKDLPKNWRDMPVPRKTQLRGDLWLSQESIAVKVPSTAIPQEHNVLLNPKVPDFDELVQVVATEAFSFDSRLFSSPYI